MLKNRFVEKLVLGRPRAFLLGWLLAFPVATTLSVSLPLDGDMLSLLPQDLKPIELARQVEGWMGRIDHVYLGMIRDEKTPLDDHKRFASAVAAEIEASPLVKIVMLGMDLTKLKKSVPILLGPEVVEQLGTDLKGYIKTEAKKRSGLYIDLEEDDAAEAFEFKELLASVQKRFQWKMDEAPDNDSAGSAGTGEAGKAALKRLRGKLSADANMLYYMSGDEKMITFPFRPTFPVTDLKKFPDLMTMMEAAIARGRELVPSAKDTEVYIGGGYTLQYDQREATLRDFLRSTAWTALLVILIAFATLRNPRSVFFVFVTLLISLSVTFGIAYFTVAKVNVITVFLLAVLAGLGIDFGLYFSTRYSLFTGAGLDRENAAREAWHETAKPALMGALTTVLVFALLGFARFRGFAELGIISAVGVAVMYVGMYTLLPAFFLLFQKRVNVGGSVTVAEARALLRGSDTLQEKEEGHEGVAGGRVFPIVAVSIAAVVTAVAYFSARQVEFKYSGEELTVEGQRSLEIDKKILQHYEESIDQTVVVMETEARARAVHQHFVDNQDKYVHIARYDSVVQMWPPEDEQRASIDAMGPLKWALKRLPKDEEDADLAFAYDLGRGMRKPEIITLQGMPPAAAARYFSLKEDGTPQGFLGFLVPRKWLWDVDSLRDFVSEVDSILVDGEPLHVSGRPHVFKAVIDVVQQEATRFSTLALVLILVILWIQARSLRFALLMILPLLVGVVWMLGTLPYVGGGVDLSFVNLVVFPILVGLGVSYGVQMVYAYRLYGSAVRALRVTVVPVSGSAATTLAGWSSLLLASMFGMRGMGWVATMGMLCIASFSMLVLPALLAMLSRKGWLPHGHAASKDLGDDDDDDDAAPDQAVASAPPSS